MRTLSNNYKSHRIKCAPKMCNQQNFQARKTDLKCSENLTVDCGSSYRTAHHVMCQYCFSYQLMSHPSKYQSYSEKNYPKRQISKSQIIKKREIQKNFIEEKSKLQSIKMHKIKSRYNIRNNRKYQKVYKDSTE